MREFNWAELESCDLIVDAYYEGGRAGNAGDDPLTRLLGVSNQGGFRYLGRLSRPNLVVLTSSLSDPDWPDELDPQTGTFTYFGDNKKPGRELHSTPRFGNQLLRDLFEASHLGPERRRTSPPVLVFSSAGQWRDVVFKGMAVPGVAGLSPVEDLVAVWKVKGGQRFQNYRAKFTILDVPIVPRNWLRSVQAGVAHTADAPSNWIRWLESGDYIPLRAERSVQTRTRDEQLPTDPLRCAILDRIRIYYSADPFGFEACACKVLQLHLEGITKIDLTRPYRDGGRDALGLYRIGSGASSIDVEFALEAKCYATTTPVGVTDVSRLISRLRHRQFGVIVTTSYVHLQAYREIVEDGHPIMVMSAKDICDVLVNSGLSSPEKLDTWLKSASHT